MKCIMGWIWNVFPHTVSPCATFSDSVCAFSLGFPFPLKLNHLWFPSISQNPSFGNSSECERLSFLHIKDFPHVLEMEEILKREDGRKNGENRNKMEKRGGSIKIKIYDPSKKFIVDV